MLVNMIEMGVGGNAAVLCGTLSPQVRSMKCCHAGIRLGADGNIYELNNAGTGWQFLCSWLLGGANTVYQVERTIDTGSLNTDAGAGPLALSSNRDYQIQQCVFGGTKTTLLTLEIQLVSDSSVVDNRQYTLRAELP